MPTNNHPHHDRILATLERYVDRYDEIRKQTSVTDIWSSIDDQFAKEICEYIDIVVEYAEKPLKDTVEEQKLVIKQLNEQREYMLEQLIKADKQLKMIESQLAYAQSPGFF